MITVLRPDKTSPRAAVDGGLLATRGPVEEDAVLTLIDNGKSHAKLVLELLAAEVRVRIPQVARVDVVSKTSAGLTVTGEQALAIAERSAIVITGLGDCGACSSCSTLDAIAFEKLGIPASVVITEPFVPLVEKFARMAGMPGYHNVVLPHPVATRSDAELRRLVAGIADRIVVQLTVGTPIREPELVSAN